MHNARRSHAFTLVEIVVTIFIMTIVSLAIYNFISRARYVSTMTQARGDARQDAQIILRYLERDISNSRAIVDPNDPSRVEKTLQVNGSNLTMEVPVFELSDDATYFDGDVSGEDDNYRSVEYTLNGRVLSRNVEGGATRVLSSDVKELEVLENYDGKIKVLLVVEKELRGYHEAFAENTQRAVFTVREAADAEVDPRWRQRIDETSY